MLICRQVDDLAIGCDDPELVCDLVQTICAEGGIDLRDEGILASLTKPTATSRYRVKATLTNC